MKQRAWVLVVAMVGLAGCSATTRSASDAGDEPCADPCGLECCDSVHVCGVRGCVLRCEPKCDGKECGDDGCGGTCGTCPTSRPYECTDEGQCVLCTPSCSGKVCGPDGCGGSCGRCETSQTCKAGACQSCSPECAGRTCGSDGCGGTCAPGCGAGQTCNFVTGTCVCQKSCSGKQCGDDGCGGSCGTCGTGESCGTDGKCLGCQKSCSGKECGDDGCGGSCGTCDFGKCVSGQCESCTAACSGKECGDDGCGGSCGTCDSGKCVSGQCESCTASCSGKECGDDGCGGSCGTCTGAFSCNAQGRCACVPSCSGKQCGDDGCGGSCGTCAPPTTCSSSGQCEAPPNHAPDIASLTLSGTITQSTSSGAATVSASVTDADGLGDLSGGLLRDPRNGQTVKAFTGSVGSYSLTLGWSDFAAADLTFGASGGTVDLEAVFFDRASATATKTLPVKLSCKQSGYSACSGSCFDLRTDPANCGGCGVTVPTYGTCNSGVPGCDTYSTLCGTTCRGLSWDNENCGACGHRCDDWAKVFGPYFLGSCASGVCRGFPTSTTATSCSALCAAYGTTCVEDQACETLYVPNLTDSIFAGCADYLWPDGRNCVGDQKTLACGDTPPASFTVSGLPCTLSELRCLCAEH
ncbi:MAG: hypothetical protein QM765_34550 [Myxococcales bacterium]